MRKVRRKRAPVAKRTARRSTRRQGSRISLSLEEREVLREACRRYQHDLPSYLKTAWPEVGLLEEILRKL